METWCSMAGVLPTCAQHVKGTHLRSINLLTRFIKPACIVCMAISSAMKATFVESSMASAGNGMISNGISAPSRAR